MVDEEQELLASSRALQSERFFKMEPEVLSWPEVDERDERWPDELCRRLFADMYIQGSQWPSPLLVCDLLCLQLDVHSRML